MQQDLTKQQEQQDNIISISEKFEEKIKGLVFHVPHHEDLAMIFQPVSSLEETVVEGVNTTCFSETLFTEAKNVAEVGDFGWFVMHKYYKLLLNVKDAQGAETIHHIGGFALSLGNSAEDGKLVVDISDFYVDDNYKNKNIVPGLFLHLKSSFPEIFSDAYMQILKPTYLIKEDSDLVEMWIKDKYYEQYRSWSFIKLHQVVMLLTGIEAVVWEL